MFPFVDEATHPRCFSFGGVLRNTISAEARFLGAILVPAPMATWAFHTSSMTSSPLWGCEAGRPAQGETDPQGERPLHVPVPTQGDGPARSHDPTRVGVLPPRSHSRDD